MYETKYLKIAGPKRLYFSGSIEVVLGGFYSDNKSHNRYSDGKRGRFNTNLRYRITDRLSIGLNANFIKTKGSSWFYWDADNKNDFDSLREPNESTRSSSESNRYNIDPHLTYFDKNNGKYYQTIK